MTYRNLTIIDESRLGRYNDYSVSVFAPVDAEYYILDYYVKHGALPLMESVLSVSKLAKQGVKVRLK